MQRLWTFPLALALVALRPLTATHVSETAARHVEACNPEGDDEGICGQMSLLQTSVTLSKQTSEKVVTKPVRAPRKAKYYKKGRKSRSSRKGKLSGHERAKVVLASVSTLNSAHGTSGTLASHTVFILANVALVAILVLVFGCLRSDRNAAEVAAEHELMQHHHPSEVEVRKSISFDEDVYMMAVALICRDWQVIVKGSKHTRLALVRIAYAAGLLFVTMGMQIGLLIGTKMYVTPQAVADIRESYDAFESWMYMNNTYVLADTGKNRGIDGYFNISMFDSFDEDIKGDVCQIPFSQLKFLVLILLIWAFTCAAQLNRCATYGYNLLWTIPTISSMADSIRHQNHGLPRAKRTIVGLTLAAKLAIFFVVLLPWFCSTCFLCYLGCRWLAATADFGDFLSNGMALEFILQFKTIMYIAVASERTKRDVQTTKHIPPEKHTHASYAVYYDAVIWGLISVAWVYLYIYCVQSVLPEYKWDVHTVCTPYLSGQLLPDDDV